MNDHDLVAEMTWKNDEKRVPGMIIGSDGGNAPAGRQCAADAVRKHRNHYYNAIASEQPEKL